MPVLKNPRWEAFAQNRAAGMPAYKAYLEAGYKVSSSMAFTAGSRLSRNVHVRNRTRELVETLAETMNVTRESLAAELDDAAAQAAELGQTSARVSALQTKAKLFGLEAPSRSVNLNISGTFNGMTDDELQFELASMLNEVRAAAGKVPVTVPVLQSVAQTVARPGKIGAKH
jgi:hypothetical protein